jgi:hypothetical protein
VQELAHLALVALVLMLAQVVPELAQVALDKLVQQDQVLLAVSVMHLLQDRQYLRQILLVPMLPLQPQLPLTHLMLLMLLMLPMLPMLPVLAQKLAQKLAEKLAERVVEIAAEMAAEAMAVAAIQGAV